MDLIAVGNDLVLSFSAVFLDGLSVLVSRLLELSKSILVSLGCLRLGGRLCDLCLEFVSEFLLDLVVGLVRELGQDYRVAVSYLLDEDASGYGRDDVLLSSVGSVSSLRRLG